jgi:Helix-turn-helix domain
METTKQALARRASKSRTSSEPVFVPPIWATVEQPVTTQQLAAHLQVSVRTLATYREQRLIPYWRINSRNLRYRISDVERALSRNNV